MQQHVGAFLEKRAYTRWLQSDNLMTAQSSLSFLCWNFCRHLMLFWIKSQNLTFPPKPHTEQNTQCFTCSECLWKILINSVSNFNRTGQKLAQDRFPLFSLIGFLISSKRAQSRCSEKVISFFLQLIQAVTVKW